MGTHRHHPGPTVAFCLLLNHKRPLPTASMDPREVFGVSVGPVASESRTRGWLWVPGPNYLL